MPHLKERYWIRDWVLTVQAGTNKPLLDCMTTLVYNQLDKFSVRRSERLLSNKCCVWWVSVNSDLTRAQSTGTLAQWSVPLHPKTCPSADKQSKLKSIMPFKACGQGALCLSSGLWYISKRYETLIWYPRWMLCRALSEWSVVYLYFHWEWRYMFNGCRDRDQKRLYRLN